MRTIAFPQPLENLMNTLTRLAALGAVVLASMACVLPAAAQQDNMIDTVKAHGKLQVGFSSFGPGAMRDKKGEWVGFEVDVAGKLAKDLGVKLELIPTAWDGIIPSLIARKFDVIIGGMSITPERQQQIDFTAPYSQSGQGVVASKATASGLKWPDGYNSAKVTMACRRGVMGCKVLEEKFPKATIRQFDDDAIAFQEVMNGKAQLVIASEPMPTFVMLKNPDKLFKPTPDNVTTSVEGMGVRKGDTASLAVLNDWIGKNQAWLKQRHTYWFSTRDWAANVPE